MTSQRRPTGQLQRIDGGRSSKAPRTRPSSRASLRAEARHAYALDVRTRQRGREGVAQAKAILASVGRPEWHESAAS